MPVVAQGDVRKMRTELGASGEPVRYTLPLGDNQVDMNALIGSHIHLAHSGHIHCIACGRAIKKSFNQGYCFPCLRSLPECDSCIVKPELCHYAEGTCRDPAWGDKHCMQDHYVYLANSSGLKVGITRGTQIPTRWMDQGAVQAIPVFRVRDRKTSGLVEVAFKNHVADKTNWRAMLKGNAEPLDMIAKRDELISLVEQGDDEVNKIREDLGEDAIAFLADAQPVEIHYPVQHWPTKITSLNFDKTPEISGLLHGIKGQYLMLDTGVLNMRKFGGYDLSLST